MVRLEKERIYSRYSTNSEWNMHFSIKASLAEALEYFNNMPVMFRHVI